MWRPLGFYFCACLPWNRIHWIVKTSDPDPILQTRVANPGNLVESRLGSEFFGGPIERRRLFLEGQIQSISTRIRNAAPNDVGSGAGAFQNMRIRKTVDGAICFSSEAGERKGLKRET